MGGAFSFVVITGSVLAAAGALSGIAVEEVTKELGATAFGLTKRSAVGNVIKPPLHELGKAILSLQDSGAPPFKDFFKVAGDVAKDVCITAVSLDALYCGYKLLRPVIEGAVKKAWVVKEMTKIFRVSNQDLYMFYFVVSRIKDFLKFWKIMNL
jgi:hypothetical protein